MVQSPSLQYFLRGQSVSWLHPVSHLNSKGIHSFIYVTYLKFSKLQHLRIFNSERISCSYFGYHWIMFDGKEDHGCSYLDDCTFEKYDVVSLVIKSKSEEILFPIYGMSGLIYYEKNIENCYVEKNKISCRITNNF